MGGSIFLATGFLLLMTLNLRLLFCLLDVGVVGADARLSSDSLVGSGLLVATFNLAPKVCLLTRRLKELGSRGGAISSPSQTCCGTNSHFSLGTISFTCQKNWKRSLIVLIKKIFMQRFAGRHLMTHTTLSEVLCKHSLCSSEVADADCRV